MIFILLILTACTSALKKDSATKYASLDRNARAVPITVFIDEAFVGYEQKAISKAFNDWMSASNHTIYFTLVWNMPKPGLYKTHKMTSGSIFLWKLDKTSDQISDADLKNWDTYLGVWDSKSTNSGNIIIFSHVIKKAFYKIVAHEIGHMLGLVHTNMKHDALMHPHTTESCITKLDAQQLCNIYNCIPKPLCD